MRIDTDALAASSQAAQTGQAKHAPGGDFAAMIYDGRLSGETLAAKQAAVDALRDSASGAVSGGSAKTFLASLNAQDLMLLQQAAGLADRINVASLSEEGAANLLLEQGSRVDQNNDGLVEVGAAKTIVFPPVNAPQSVKDAWDAATAGMSEQDRMSLTGWIALPMTFAATMADHAGDSPQLSDMAHDGFDWNALIARLLDGIEASRPYNTAAQMDMLEDGVTRFGDELKQRGLA
jgi:hypothetical protein